MVHEYLDRIRFADLGYTRPIDSDSSFVRESFLIIAGTIDELREKDRQKDGA